jgi:hypothetical protein
VSCASAPLTPARAARLPRRTYTSDTDVAQRRKESY